MNKRGINWIFIFFAKLFLLSAFTGKAQDSAINNKVVSFQKKEWNKGILLNFGQEREELRTDETRYYEEQNLFNGRFFLENKRWNLLDYKQEELSFSFELGPFGGSGSWIDSSKVSNRTADETSYGIRTSLNAGYRLRYYYDPKTYTVFDLSGWGRYDVYKQKLQGTAIDSLGVSTPIDENSTKDRLRYGFKGKVGWGTGRLSPMNHLMTAHYLLEKYYPGRVFSDYEIAQFAQVIANIKHDRDAKTGHDADKEMDLVAAFVNKTLLLEKPEVMAGEWQFGEFDPRYEGRRFEFGPFFQYFNREPDFVYGGYAQFERAKYQNVKWNSNISANINYNRYKKQDWMTAELNVGWSYYSNLKSQVDFGIKYVPGIELNGFSDVGPLSHNFIPYVAWYSQLNSTSRFKVDFSWRIADGEQFVLPGPNFTLAFYRSSY